MCLSMSWRRQGIKVADVIDSEYDWICVIVLTRDS
jgi:hypothetical protein